MPNSLIIFAVLCFCTSKAQTANVNPYSVFGYTGKVLKTPEEESGKQYLYLNTGDTTKNLKSIIFNTKTHLVEYIDHNNVIYKTDSLLPTMVLRFLSVDPKASKLPFASPYVFCLNSTIIIVDPDGQFPILVNGLVGAESERGDASYWSPKIFSTITLKTGFLQASFKFVDGDKDLWPLDRAQSGTSQGTLDAPAVYAKLKETMKDGMITEQLQFITHSKGGAFGAGYMQGLNDEVLKLAEKDLVGFSYGKENLIEYSVNLAPHQSNFIDYQKNGSKNINISHVGDLLSGDDATGNVINVQSIPENDDFLIGQHANRSYATELNFVLDILEKNKLKTTLLDEVKKGYETYDSKRTNGGKSKVTGAN